MGSSLGDTNTQAVPVAHFQGVTLIHGILYTKGSPLVMKCSGMRRGEKFYPLGFICHVLKEA